MAVITFHICAILDVFRLSHIFVSVYFSIVTIVIFVRFFLAIRKKLIFRKFDSFLSLSFLIALYIQSFLGFFLMFFLEKNSYYEYLFLGNHSKSANQRFWPIEHTILMIFSIVIAHLGFVLSKKFNSNRKKFRTILIFYFITVLLAIFSLSLNYM